MPKKNSHFKTHHQRQRKKTLKQQKSQNSIQNNSNIHTTSTKNDPNTLRHYITHAHNIFNKIHNRYRNHSIYELRTFHFILDCILFFTGAIYVVFVPYTKVEESFNMQAVHDILFHGTNLQMYDHLKYPGMHL